MLSRLQAVPLQGSEFGLKPAGPRLPTHATVRFAVVFNMSSQHNRSFRIQHLDCGEQTPLSLSAPNLTNSKPAFPRVPNSFIISLRIMKSLIEHLWFEIKSRRGFVNITDTVKELLLRSGVNDGILVCNHPAGSLRGDQAAQFP